MNWVLNLLNNWLIQAIIGNFIWVILCKTSKFLYNKFNNLKQLKNNTHSKNNFKNKFEILFYTFNFFIFTLECYFLNYYQYDNPIILLYSLLLFVACKWIFLICL